MGLCKFKTSLDYMLRPCLKNKNKTKKPGRLECSSVGKHLSRTCKVLGSIPSTTEREKLALMTNSEKEI